MAACGQTDGELDYDGRLELLDAVNSGFEALQRGALLFVVFGVLFYFLRRLTRQHYGWPRWATPAFVVGALLLVIVRDVLQGDLSDYWKVDLIATALGILVGIIVEAFRG